MPLLAIQTSVSMSRNQAENLACRLSVLVADTIGKPEQYVMVTVTDSTITMGGSPEPAAFVDVRSIGGLSREINLVISDKVCRCLLDELRIPGDRVYLNFQDVERSNWGYNHKTFG